MSINISSKARILKIAFSGGAKRDRGQTSLAIRVDYPCGSPRFNFVAKLQSKSLYKVYVGGKLVVSGGLGVDVVACLGLPTAVILVIWCREGRCRLHSPPHHHRRPTMSGCPSPLTTATPPLKSFPYHRFQRSRTRPLPARALQHLPPECRRCQFHKSPVVALDAGLQDQRQCTRYIEACRSTWHREGYWWRTEGAVSGISTSYFASIWR